MPFTKLHPSLIGENFEERVVNIETSGGVSTLSELTDATITTPGTGEVLTYSAGNWINSPATGGGGETATAGTGKINYVKNPEGASGTAGWDWANGLTLSTTITPSEVLRGDESFKIAATSTTISGYVDIEMNTFDRADTSGTVSSIQFDYEHIDYISGLALVVLDVDNDNNEIIPSLSELPHGYGKFEATWLPTSSRNYKIRIKSNYTGAAGNLFLDNVTVGPNEVIQGAAIGDWQTFTPTGLWTTNTTYTGQWRRVGDSMEIHATAAILTGAPNTATFTLDVPFGLTFDTSKIPAGVLNAFPLGSAVASDSGSGYYLGVPSWRYATSQIEVMGQDTENYWTQAVPFSWTNGDSANVQMTIPIVGWSSNTILSNSRVEYVYNSDDSNADDTDSFAWGSEGIAIGSFTTARTKTVQFKTAIQPMDKVGIEIYENGAWADQHFLNNFLYDGAAHRGVYLQPTGADNKVDAKFMALPADDGAWSDHTSKKWRVYKSSNPLAVETPRAEYPAIGDWNEFEMVIESNGGTNPVKGTIVRDKAYWRRIGDSMEITYSYEQSSTGTNSSSTSLFNLPSGYTIDTSKIPAAGNTEIQSICGNGAVDDGTNERLANVVVWDTGRLAMMQNNAGGATTISAAIMNFGTYSSFMVSFKATVPITGWSSNTILADSKVEYAYNSDTANSDDTSSFATGSEGGLVPGVITSSKTKRVRFSRAFKHYILEVKDYGVGPWLNVNGTRYQNKRRGGADTGSDGMGLDPINDTDIDVWFSASGAWDDLNADTNNTWVTENSNGTRWRVVGSDNPSMVETPRTVYPAIGDWTEFEMIITGGGVAKKGSPVTDKAVWRRVGDSMEIRYHYAHTSGGSTAGSGTYFFNIPGGYTINTNKMPVGPGYYRTHKCGTTAAYSTSHGSGAGYVQAYNETQLILQVEDISASTEQTVSGTYFDMAETDIQLGFNATVPIVGWSSNTVLGDSQVEYVYNTTTNDGTDEVSFAYGEEGGLVPDKGETAASLTCILKRVQFSKSWKHAKIEIQVGGAGSWINGADIYPSFFWHSTVPTYYRIGIAIQPVSPTQYDVSFAPLGAYYDGNGTSITWSTEYSAGTRWRVVGYDSPMAVEMPPTTTESAIGDWNQFYMQIKGTGSDPTKATAPDIDKAMWRRVGDSMEIKYDYIHTTNTSTDDGTGDYLFELPPGYVIDSSKITISTNEMVGVCGSAAGTADEGDGQGFVKVYNATALAIVLDDVSASSQLTISSTWYNIEDNTVRYSFLATVPIVGWSSNTVFADSRVEYAHNSSVTNLDDMISFAYGASGSIVPSVASSTKSKRVKFTTAIGSSERMCLEVQQDGKDEWIDAGNSGYNYFLDGGGNNRGVWIEPVNSNSGIIDVRFGDAGSKNSNWATEASAGTRWRVVKSANPLAVESELNYSSSIGDWQPFNMTIDATTDAPDKSTTIDIDKAMWRRVGDSMEITYDYGHSSYTGGGDAGNGQYFFQLPSGYIVDTSKISTCNGSTIAGACGSGWTTSTNDSYGIITPCVFTGGTSLILAVLTSTTAFFIDSTTAETTNTTLVYSFRAVVPIVGWSTNIVLEDSRVEYVYNSDTTTNDNELTSFAYGAAGGLVPALSGNEYKRMVRFQQSGDIQNSKRITVEIQPNGTGPWLDASIHAGWSLVDASGMKYSGIYADVVNTTDIDIYFGRDGLYTPTVGWNSWANEKSAGTRWRVVRCDNPLAIESATISRVIYLKDVKANNVAGGDFNNGDWRTRDLNTLEDPSVFGFCSLSANQFTLTPGTYEIYASAPCYRGDYHKIKLLNITDTSDEIIGSNAFAVNVNAVQTHSFISGLFSIASSKVFEICHYCSTTQGVNGLGQPTNFSVDEVYTQVMIRKLA